MTGHAALKGFEYQLYVLELVGLGVKVGISVDPNKRLRRHRKVASDHNVECGRVWISGIHQEARANERRLIALGGEKNRREYLAVGFDTAVAVARALRMTRVSNEVRSAEMDRAANSVSCFWPAGTTKADVLRMAEAVFER